MSFSNIFQAQLSGVCGATTLAGQCEATSRQLKCNNAPTAAQGGAAHSGCASVRMSGNEAGFFDASPVRVDGQASRGRGVGVVAHTASGGRHSGDKRVGAHLAPFGSDQPDLSHASLASPSWRTSAALVPSMGTFLHVVSAEPVALDAPVRDLKVGAFSLYSRAVWAQMAWATEMVAVVTILVGGDLLGRGISTLEVLQVLGLPGVCGLEVTLDERDHLARFTVMGESSIAGSLQSVWLRGIFAGVGPIAQPCWRGLYSYPVLGLTLRLGLGSDGALQLAAPVSGGANATLVAGTACPAGLARVQTVGHVGEGGLIHPTLGHIADVRAVMWAAGPTDSENAPADGVFPNQRGGSRSDRAGPLANGVPLATLYHAATVLLQSDNAQNHFGPSVFEAESQWAGREWHFGTAAAGTVGQYGVESVVREMEFTTHETDGSVRTTTRPWGVRVCGPQRPYVTAIVGDPEYTAPLGVVRLEGWDLLRADTPSRSAKAVVTHAANYRYVTEQNLRSTIWPIIDAATPGGCYRRWWLKFWLDWIGTATVEAYAAEGVRVVNGPMVPMPAVHELSNAVAAADSTFVETNLVGIVNGEFFLHDVSQESQRSPLYAAFVRRYAASWPREQRTLGGLGGRMLYVDQVIIPGAAEVVWLNGSRGQLGAGVWPAQISTRQLLGLARQFMQATNSYVDCMSSLEQAVSVAFADPYGNVLPQQMHSLGDDPVVVNCGRGRRIPVSVDNSLPAFLAPFYSGEVHAHVANDVLSMRCEVLRQEVVYYHVALSQAHAIARMVASFTCDQLIAGVASEQVAALVRKEGVKRHIAKFDRLVANVCAHTFGFIPYESTLSGQCTDAVALGLRQEYGSAVVYAPMWVPQQWLGYEVCEVMLMMPEGWALTGPGARFQADLTKGAPGRDRHFSTNFVRLFRSLPVLDDYMWLGDGGQAHGASHICAGQGAHFYVQSRGWWKKPYLAEEPSAPNYLPLMWVDKVGLPGVIVPGQFPVWHDEDEVNVAWGLKLNPNKQSHELGGILNRQPDCTRYRTFIARNGFLADDPTRVTRLMPALRVYDVFKQGLEPGTPLAAVTRAVDPGLDIDPTGELVAEANSMSDFVAADATTATDAQKSGDTRGKWHATTARGGRKRVGIRQRFVMGSGQSGAVSTSNRFGALATKTEGGAAVQQRQRDAEDASRQSQPAAVATQQLAPRTSNTLAAQTGPSDDELIATAIKVAQAERARLQAAGAGSAPPLKSYAEAVRSATDGAAAVDVATQRAQGGSGPGQAVPHPSPEMTSRDVRGKPVAVPTDYVAPPSQASEDMLAAVASGALGRKPDPNIQGSKN